MDTFEKKTLSLHHHSSIRYQELFSLFHRRALGVSLRLSVCLRLSVSLRLSVCLRLSICRLLSVTNCYLRLGLLSVWCCCGQIPSTTWYIHIICYKIIIPNKIPFPLNLTINAQLELACISEIIPTWLSNEG